MVMCVLMSICIDVLFRFNNVYYIVHHTVFAWDVEYFCRVAEHLQDFLVFSNVTRNLISFYEYSTVSIWTIIMK